MEASDWPREGMNRPIAAASQSVPSPCLQEWAEACKGSVEASPSKHGFLDQELKEDQ